MYTLKHLEWMVGNRPVHAITALYSDGKSLKCGWKQRDQIDWPKVVAVQVWRSTWEWLDKESASSGKTAIE